MNAYKEIYEQFVEESSFLWGLRSVAIEEPNQTLSDIQELEQRIDAQIDGIMSSIEDAWEICLESLASEGPGEVFTASVVAFKSHDMSKIQKAIEAGLSNETTLHGLVSALGWLPEKLVHPWIKKFLTSKDLDHKYLAIAACSVRRENPGEFLNKILSRDDCKEHTKLYARSLRLIGELRRQDLMPALDEAMSVDDDDIKFWASWSSILLGNRTAVSNLKPFVFESGVYQDVAINIVFRVLPIEQARLWISKLAEDKDQARAVIKATGVLGDPHAVNWLISVMKDPLLARISAEAMNLITALDLEKLNMESPVEIVDQIEDDELDDEDENLLWPDANKVSQVWMNMGMNFIAGNRYFMGSVISPQLLQDKLITATQRQRHAAAMELALSNNISPLQNTRAKI